MEAAHLGCQVAILCHLLAMYSARILLTTALNVEVIGVKYLGSVVTGKVSPKHRSKSVEHMMRHQESHLSMSITTNTEEGSHSLHKVDVKLPIALSVSLMLSF